MTESELSLSNPIPEEFPVESTANGITIVRLTGDLDLRCCELLIATYAPLVNGPDIPRVLTNTAELTFVDSAVLGVLLRAARRCRDRGGYFYLCAPTAFVRRALRITAIHQVIPVFDMQDAALAAMRRAIDEERAVDNSSRIG